MAPKHNGDSVKVKILWSVLTAALSGGMLLLVSSYFSIAHETNLSLLGRVNALEIRDAAKTEQIAESRRTYDSIDGRLKRIEEHLLRKP